MNEPLTIDLDLQIAECLAVTINYPPHEVMLEWISLVLLKLAVDKKEIYSDSVELTIRLVDEDEIQQLNKIYRHINKSTNILSFPFEAPDYIPLNLLGDLVICHPIIEKEARLQNKNITAHWAHIIIHGMLHLLGYDHIKDHEAEVMETIEIEILFKLGFDNPYI